MKKNDLIKVLGIIFIALIIMSWCIPSGAYSSGQLTTSGVTPYGIFDWFRIPFSTLTSYALYGLYIVVIGGFYGVMKKTGAYDRLVAFFVNKYESNKRLFVAVTIAFFAVLSSLSGLEFVLLILVPLFVAILLAMNVSKLNALLATIGAILVGNIGSITGFNVVGYANYYFSLSLSNSIWYKLALLIFVTALLIFFVVRNIKDEPEVIVKPEKKEAVKVAVSKKTTKKTKKKNKGSRAFAKIKDEVLVTDSKKSIWPLLVILDVVVILLLVASYNWYYGTGFQGFEAFYEQLTSWKINDFAIVYNLLGTFDPFGYWTLVECNIVLIIASLLLTWIYSVNFKEACAGFLDGVKEALPVAFYIMIANVIIYAVLGAVDSNIAFSISDAILGLSSNFNIWIATIYTAVMSFFINDFTYLVGYLYAPLEAVYTDTAVYPILTVILQAIHGLAMLVLPTSAILIAGLSYLKISYKEYLKYVWKFLIGVFVICMLIIVIASLI